MLGERQLAALRAFSQKLGALQKSTHELHRAIHALIAEASGLGLMGPAEDAGALLADADILNGDLEGKLRQAGFGLAALLNAQALPNRVAELGWTFDGWNGDAGWQAWRTWEPGGDREVVADRLPSALLDRLTLRNREAAHHG